MGRTVRSGFWSARRQALAICLFGFGLVFLVALAGAQKQENKNVVMIQRPSLAVNLSLVPGKQKYDLDLRVRTNPLLKNPPEVEFQDMAGGTVRTLKIEADKRDNSWMATITDLQPFDGGYVYVTVATDSGVVERHELRFANRGMTKNQPSVLFSAEGQFAFVIFPGGAPVDTRFLVTTFGVPDPPLPVGVKLEAGPFQIMAAQQIPDTVKANVAIHLAEPSANSKAPAYQVRWLNPAKAAWEVLPESESNSRVTQARVARLGMFVLTSETK